MNLFLIGMNTVMGVMLIILILSPNFPLKKLGFIGRIGIWLCGLGLLAQALRTGMMTATGSFPFEGFPIWIIKDIGLWSLTVGFIEAWIKDKKPDD